MVICTDKREKDYLAWATDHNLMPSKHPFGLDSLATKQILYINQIQRENDYEAFDKYHASLTELRRVGDHTRFWVDKDGRPGAITTEPYNLYPPDLLDLYETCEKLDLAVRVSGRSMYLPGRCLFILISPKGTSGGLH